MPVHDLIVIGASAGGVEALIALVAGLPADLPAAVCVAMHLRPYGESQLAGILARAGALPAVAAEHGARLRPGTIHVAVPDLHLLVERDGNGGVIRLTHGPRENRNRPAVDPLFRSAALAYGPRVIGVVLSGALDDGTAGLWTVRDRGGLAVVQDPTDAAVQSMPRSALTEVGVDHVATARELGPLLGRLAREPVAGDRRDAHPDEPDSELAREMAIAAMSEVAHQRQERYGSPSRFPCPDCGGVLWRIGAHGPLRFRCETGHAHSAASLEEAQVEDVERTLWSALRALEDRIALARERNEHARARGLGAQVERLVAEEEAAEQHAAAVRMLLRLGGRASTQAPARVPDGAPTTDLSDPPSG
jgi:two-component system, chemotaxis family, protein-glutamate methylesterase/glutaminase